MLEQKINFKNKKEFGNGEDWIYFVVQNNIYVWEGWNWLLSNFRYFLFWNQAQQSIKLLKTHGGRNSTPLLNALMPLINIDTLINRRKITLLPNGVNISPPYSHLVFKLFFPNLSTSLKSLSHITKVDYFCVKTILIRC